MLSLNSSAICRYVMTLEQIGELSSHVEFLEQHVEEKGVSPDTARVSALLVIAVITQQIFSCRKPLNLNNLSLSTIIRPGRSIKIV